MIVNLAFVFWCWSVYFRIHCSLEFRNLDALRKPENKPLIITFGFDKFGF